MLSTTARIRAAWSRKLCVEVGRCAGGRLQPPKGNEATGQRLLAWEHPWMKLGEAHRALNVINGRNTM